MGHHAEDVSCLVYNARDGARGPIRAPPFIGVRWTADVSKYDATISFQSIDGFGVRCVTPVAMSDWNSQLRTSLVAVAEHCISRLDTHANQLTDEFEAFVAQQRTREKASLARDLKTIANSQDGTATVGKL